MHTPLPCLALALSLLLPTHVSATELEAVVDEDTLIVEAELESADVQIHEDAEVWTYTLSVTGTLQGTLEHPPKTGVFRQPIPVLDLELGSGLEDALEVGEIYYFLAHAEPAKGAPLEVFWVEPARSKIAIKKILSDRALGFDVSEKAPDGNARIDERKGPPQLKMPDPATAQRGLSREAIRKVVQANKANVRACYTSHTGDLGRVELEWVITASGTVRDVKLETENPADALKACVIQEIQSWTFPAPNPGREITVRYPF